MRLPAVTRLRGGDAAAGGDARLRRWRRWPAGCDGRRACIRSTKLCCARARSVGPRSSSSSWAILSPRHAFAQDRDIRDGREVRDARVAPVAALADRDALADARKLKLVGAGLSGAGFGLNAVGSALMLGSLGIPNACIIDIAAEEGPCAYPTPAQQRINDRAAGLFLGGAIISLVGDAVMAAGLPIWHVGAKRERAARSRLANSGR